MRNAMSTEPAPCPYCGKPLPEAAANCASCGKALPSVPHTVVDIEAMRKRYDTLLVMLWCSLGWTAVNAVANVIGSIIAARPLFSNAILMSSFFMGLLMPTVVGSILYWLGKELREYGRKSA